MADIPASHKEDSLKLNPQEFVELFDITLVNGSKIRAHSGREYQWHPTNVNTPWTFDDAFIKVSGFKRNSGEQRIRPTLTIGNPLDVFHVPVAEGHLEGATVVRYKIKPDNLAADPPAYEKNVWYIAQITGLGELITAQLRSRSDRQEGVIPSRQFLKPEFSSVSI